MSYPPLYPPLSQWGVFQHAFVHTAVCLGHVLFKKRCFVRFEKGHLSLPGGFSGVTPRTPKPTVRLDGTARRSLRPLRVAEVAAAAGWNGGTKVLSDLIGPYRETFGVPMGWSIGSFNLC